MTKKLLLILFVLFSAVSLQAQTVSLSSLLDEMVDRDSVTRFPDPAFVCVQASSYDRAAKSPAENWFANGDTSQFFREETNGNRKEWVLMDADGPGAIVRFWITAPHYKTKFRVYFDNNSTPAIEANIGDLIGGEFLVGAPFSEETARGRNLYLPIPYAKHCKITVDDMPTQGNLYYQINYRNYTKEASVETFSLENLKSLKDKIETVKQTLLSSGNELIGLSPATSYSEFIVPKGGTPLTIAGKNIVSDANRRNRRLLRTLSATAKNKVNGGVLRQIVFKVDTGDTNKTDNSETVNTKLVQALRSTVLSIKFDGKETVWVPLGDFFGDGVGINPYKSWYSRVEKDGRLISLWQMPFQKTMDVSLINYGTENVKITLISLETDQYDWNERSMYFHADWRQQRQIETLAGKGTIDWNYVKLNGKGVFVGDVLSVVNRDSAWWGEGDEKIYVDGESFPSHFGTGTEDYYGYAWCTPKFFESPFHFQPRAEGPKNYGNTTNGRVRLLDTIPFATDFRFDMEIWHWKKTKIDYSVVTFWYGFESTTVTDFQSRPVQIAEVQAPVAYQTPVFLDFQGFRIEKLPTGGTLQLQGMEHFKGGKWDNNDQLWWTGAKTGDKLELLLDVEKDGNYKLVAELTKAKDYGIVQFHFGNKKIGQPVDLYNSEVIPTGELELPVVIELKAGRYPVVVEIIGKNDNAEPKYMVGIDRLMLVPIK
ncbi:MAG: DUF2961 domain-containing protein [Planctomycetaceae bacterium]|jgi:hypothetical protein|nr:DUF2961 domain-containing protein [Planctomycetaceae bacterium]